MRRGVSRCCQELWPQGQLKEPRSREARGWRPPTMRPLDREHVGKGQTRGQHAELELGRSCRRLRRWRLQNQRLGPRRLFGGHERRHSIDPTSPYGSMCTLWHQRTHYLDRPIRALPVLACCLLDDPARHVTALDCGRSNVWSRVESQQSRPPAARNGNAMRWGSGEPASCIARSMERARSSRQSTVSQPDHRLVPPSTRGLCDGAAGHDASGLTATQRGMT